MKRAILLGALSIAAVACHSDPNTQVNSAQQAQLESQRKHEEQASTDRKDYLVDDAENQRKGIVAQGVPGDHADQKRLKADAKMTEARRVAVAKADDRLQRADARTNELKALVNQAGGKATTQSRDALQAVDNQRVAAQMSINQMTSTDDAGFKQAKDYSESQLDTLEGYVKRAEKEVDAFK